MTTEELLENGLIESLGRTVALVQQEFRSETRVITAELRSNIAEFKSDLGAFIHQLEKRASDILANVKDGQDGTPGKDGRDAPPLEEIASHILPEVVERAVAAIPVPENGKDGKDGRDGQDADVEAIALRLVPEVERAVSALPKPENGKDGRDGKDAEPVTKELVLEAIAGSGLLNDIVSKHIAENPPLPGPPGEKGSDGRDGNDAPDITWAPDDLSLKTASAIRMLAERPIVVAAEQLPAPTPPQRETRKLFKTWRDESGALQGEVIEVPV
jgi:hypothetical protein